MTLENRVPPPVVAIGCGAVIYWLRDHYRVHFEFQAIIAGLILLASLAIMVLAVREFRRAKTTVNPLRPETASSLVQRGVFAVSRNPMYLGLLGILLAWTVFLGAPAGVAGLVLFVTWMNLLQIRPEEKAMSAIFGDDFSSYCSRVRRWL